MQQQQSLGSTCCACCHEPRHAASGGLLDSAEAAPVLLQGAVDSLQEELLVRGSLAENFCFFEVGQPDGQLAWQQASGWHCNVGRRQQAAAHVDQPAVWSAAVGRYVPALLLLPPISQGPLWGPDPALLLPHPAKQQLHKCCPKPALLLFNAVRQAPGVALSTASDVAGVLP